MRIESHVLVAHKNSTGYTSYLDSRLGKEDTVVGNNADRVTKDASEP